MSNNVYACNLPLTLTSDEFREKFRIYGNILSCKLLSGYGFINYDNSSSAQKAILGENDSQLQGKTISVRLAHPQKSNASGPPTGPPGAGPLPPDVHANKMPKMMEGNFPGSMGSNAAPPPFRGTSGMSGGPQMPRNDPYHYAPSSIGGGGVQMPPSSVAPTSAMAAAAIPKMDYVKPPQQVEKNDCEIIVLSKHLTGYAEHVERLLKNYGMAVDLLFPSEDVMLGKVLASISNRGTLYAILISNENEEFQSITINILHGIPQEHRNIPLDDGLFLISKNFEAYKNGEKSTIGVTSTVPRTEKHPEALQYLFNLLADCRQLTALQYDRVMKYLQERRDHQLKLELGGDSTDIGIDYKKNELQNRIMSILNKNTGVAQGGPSMPGGGVAGGLGTGGGGGLNSNAGGNPSISVWQNKSYM